MDNDTSSTVFKGLKILVSSAPLHCEIVIERERARGLEICDRRNEEKNGQRPDATSPKPTGEKGGQNTSERPPYQIAARASIDHQIG